MDAENTTVISVDATMPQTIRDLLWNLLVALCTGTRIELSDRDASKIPYPPSFKTLHMSFYAKYGQSVSFLQQIP